MNEEISFGRIVKEHRHAHDLTQAELARRVACATITIRKIEADALRPSQQIAEHLAMALAIPQAEQTNFVRLARTVSLVDSAPPPLPTPPPVAEEVGQKDLSGRAIRGYALGERIAVGGFGAVYHAIQPYVEREVAIKIILPQYADHPDFIRRFEAEAQLVACLEHPYIVPLYDYWREPGSAYLVMRLMRGGSLQTKLNDGPLGFDATLRLLQQIGDALHSAHRAGVVHRDIKPANILLDEDGNAYLADFGFAKNLGHANLAEQTQAGTIIGSLEYISPEQIQADRVKPQSDIYCLGIMFYEMLTGHKPFQGVTPVDYIQQHLTEPLPPLREHYPDAEADQSMLTALDAVLTRATAKSPSERYPDVIAMLADVQEMLSLHPATAIGLRQPVGKDGQPSVVSRQLEVESPYKGLRAFGEADAADFFGRETVIQTLLGRMAESDDPSIGSGQELGRFLAVVGPSGSGKSSVVRAGLIPALRQGGLPGSEQWFIVKMIPGTHPLEELEAALLRVAINPPESLLAQLREDERSLVRAVRRILPADETTELVLVIDQFEELFTLCSDEAVRVHLLDSLVMAVLDPRSRLRVVITLRADFTDRPLQYVDFGELVRHRTEFVLPLSPDEMEEAIAGPAKRVGLTLEPGLPETIIADLGDQPGTLPLLQYTLTELFERRVGNALTLGAYQASGGVRRVLASRADKLYAELDDVGQTAARQLFLRLITLGEITGDGLSAPDTRRRVLRSELASLTADGGPQTANDKGAKGQGYKRDEENSNIQNVIDQYGRHRLLTFDRDPVTRGPTVEVAHEALIREWGRLRQWLDEDREFLLWQQRLRAALRQWEASEQDEGALLRGAPLNEAENWFDQREADLSEAERNFIRVSLGLRQQRAAEREAQRQRELEAAQKLAEEQARAAAIEKQRAQDQARSNKRLRWLAIGLAVFLVGAIGAAFLAVRETQRAEQQTRLTTARELAGAAINNLDVDPERSILLALQAVSTSYDEDGTVTREAENALHEAILASRIQHTLSGHTDALLQVNYSPDGTRVVTSSYDQTAKVWDAASGQELLTLSGHNDIVDGVAFSPDGTRIATASFDRTIKIWDAASGQELLSFAGHSGEIYQLAYSPDGTRLVTSSGDQTAKVWDAASGQELFALVGHTAQLWDVVYSADGTRLATAGRDGAVKVWDAASGWELLTLPTVIGPKMGTVAFSPDGARLAAGDDAGVVTIWDISMLSGPESCSEPCEALEAASSGQELLTLHGHAGPIVLLRFSPDGAHLATGSVDGTAKVWNAVSGQEILTLAGHTSVIISVAFSPDGTHLATSSTDGTAKIWDLSPERELLTLTGHTDEIRTVAFHPDGRRLVSGSLDGTAKLWDVSTGYSPGPKVTAVATVNRKLLTIGQADRTTQIEAVAVSPDGTSLVTGGADGTAKVWDIGTGKELFTLSGHATGQRKDLDINGVSGIAFSPDGKRLATTSAGGTVKIWDFEASIAAKTGQELLTLIGHNDGPVNLPYGGVLDTAFSPDGIHLATAGADGTARVWDAATGQEMVTLPGKSEIVFDVAFNSDGTQLAVVGFDGTARVWDISTALKTGTAPDKELLTLTGHASNINAVTFSPDGTRLATGSDDGTAKVWDSVTGEELLTLSGHIGGIWDIAFSPDGTRLATAGRDKTVRLYVLPIEELMALGQSRVTRPLTTEECQQYLHVDECPASF